VVLGPVQPTPTHPDAQALGWDGFGALVRGMPVPVYALGGMEPRDLENAWRQGGQGIAMVRGSWQRARAAP
jgi:8-oxo-dGTP diphosphatase